jgi:hypothetical protein
MSISTLLRDIVAEMELAEEDQPRTHPGEVSAKLRVIAGKLVRPDGSPVPPVTVRNWYYDSNGPAYGDFYAAQLRKLAGRK